MGHGLLCYLGMATMLYNTYGFWLVSSLGAVVAAAGAVNGHAGLESLIERLIATLGPYGFLVWFAYYTISRVIPGKDATIQKTWEELLAYMRQEQQARAEERKLLQSICERLQDGKTSR